MATAADQIHLRGLELPVRIGVPEEERAAWQTLQADVIFTVPTRFEMMRDEISATVDYAAVAMRLRSLAADKPRQLIETLAADISERGATRMDDKTSEASMEKRKKEGYF